jgi:tetratricopeptide (TPR) repeat protein
MQGYGVRDVERLLGMSRSAILSLVKAGFVSPVRGARREYRFSFQDLILLRAARALSVAHVPARHISRSLKQMRQHLPASVPMSGLSIRALGDRVVVQQGRQRWQADTGQYLLELEVSVADGQITVLARGAGPAGQETAAQWFQRGFELEQVAPGDAQRAYERVLELDASHAGAATNLGRMLHEMGRLKEGERVYRQALQHSARDLLLLFNLAVLLEDAGRDTEAAAAYRSVLDVDRSFADCHYNLALLYERQGNKLGAIRHLREYRKLVGQGAG